MNKIKNYKNWEKVNRKSDYFCVDFMNVVRYNISISKHWIRSVRSEQLTS